MSEENKEKKKQKRPYGRRVRRSYLKRPLGSALPIPEVSLPDLVYQPTSQDLRFLRAALDFSHGTTIRDILHDSGLNINYYAESVKKPGWNEWFTAQFDLAVEMHVPWILIRVGMQKATTGEFKHWEALMKMVGKLQTDKTQVTTNVFTTMSEEQRKRELSKRLDRAKQRLGIDNVDSGTDS